MAWFTQVLVASLCFAVAQCSLRDIIDQGLTGIHNIGTGLGQVGSMLIPGLPVNINQRPGGIAPGEIAGGMRPGGIGVGPGGIGGVGPGGIGGGMGPGGIGGGMGPGGIGGGMGPGRGVGLAQPMKAEEALAESMAKI